jgi:pilus assembly protein Flp/PilA
MRGRRVIKTLTHFVYEERGLTTVEYAVAGALITIALVGAFTLLAGSVNNTVLAVDTILPG